MANILLLDNDDTNNRFLFHQFDRVVISPSFSPKFLAWIGGAITVLLRSTKNDKIVCWYDFQAIILFVLCKLMLKKRNIVCLNILLKFKNTLINRIVAYLYKCALSDKTFRATVTSVEYGNLLNQRFGENFNYILIHDVFHEHYKYSQSIIPVKANTVFCGGRNGRDWNFIFNVAASLPEIFFNIVVPKNIYDNYIRTVGQNVKLKTNLSYRDFIEEMLASEIVCLPLDTEAPAGLIVLFQAAANNKLIITTNTATTREYLKDGKGVLLPNVAEKWKDTIRFYLSNKDIAVDKTKAFYTFLQEQCSEECFMNIINELIK